MNPIFTVLHYNVNEMRTKELVDPKNERIERLGKTILELTGGDIPDFASFAEIEYDFKGIPSEKYTSEGENLTAFFNRIKSLSNKNYDKLETPFFDTKTAFKPGNCGMNGRAQKMENGDYCDKRNASRVIKLEYGDMINCQATIPGQYGVGFWTKYRIIDLTVISKLTWKQFNPQIDLSNYRDSKGNNIPEDITLFDKCCMIIKVQIHDKCVNFVVLHTMPAYDFGVEKSSNVDRNNDQLALLQWLLTGKTYFEPLMLLDDEGKPLTPLASNEAVIAMGDLNEDWRKKDQEAVKRLQEIHDHPDYHVFPWGKTTDIGMSGNQFQLDYMISRIVNVVPGSEQIGPMDANELSDHGALVTKFHL
jgi:hypothetical protein